MYGTFIPIIDGVEVYSSSVRGEVLFVQPSDGYVTGGLNVFVLTKEGKVEKLRLTNLIGDPVRGLKILRERIDQLDLVGLKLKAFSETGSMDHRLMVEVRHHTFDKKSGQWMVSPTLVGQIISGSDLSFRFLLKSSGDTIEVPVVNGPNDWIELKPKLLGSGL